ncbi:anti-sigma regulatory factor [Actinosynnema sp. ALI-1.44]|uniref:sensor histidine kinase n=1 Tax=Actinosynnema sp. ALI-1.44 TaxID=1933779 RepID=UPI00097C7528|nr:sensor histidine kinase [Actinosynnema sp. ALI-1.44]ONI88258.1 anti-sigma regulatory factor [Actinosynnema sp. ALI-1.44]
MSTATRPVAEPFAHPALFYRDDSEYLAGTIPFITGGLAAGEPVAVAVPGPQLDLLRAELGDAARQVDFLDMTIVGRNPGRIIPGVLRAFADQHSGSRVRIIGEPIWDGRSATEYPACVQHEALINLAFTGRAVSILCPYDSDALPPEVIADAAATHPVLIDASGQRDSDAYAPDHIVASYNQPLLAPPNSIGQDFDVATLAMLRPFAVQHAQRLGLAGPRVDDLVLVVMELATNSVEHGAGTGIVHLWAADGDLVCQVFDEGQVTDPLIGRRPAAPDQFRGRGVLMVNLLADLVRMHTSPHGTTIQVRFAL